MEEIKKYADLLSLLEMSEASKESNAASQPHQKAEEDAEALEWVSLLSKANASVMQKARLRICSAGLLAVHRHITTNPDFKR